MRLLALFIVLISTTSQAQRMGIYNFDNSLNESSGNMPPLMVLGHIGEFKDDIIPELERIKRKVYVFDKNCGFQINNRMAGGFFDGSYTIEIYFKFEDLGSWKRVIDFKNRKSDNGCYIYDGKLNFYNFALGVKAPVRAGEYTHYVMSRDAKTKQIKMYVDGQSKVEFIDKTDQGTIDADGVLNFFHDDLEVKDEASEGAIAMLKIYDYVVQPTEVKNSFVKLSVNIKETPNKNITAPKTPAQLPQISTPKEQKKTLDPNKQYSWQSLVKNSTNKQSIEIGNITILDSNMLETKTLTFQKGRFELLVYPYQEYNVIIEAMGYLPLGLHLSSQKVQELIEHNNVLYLEPIEIGKAFVLKDLFFVQSKAELMPESRLEVARIIEFMKNNAKAEIELQGHTDNQGDFDLNLQLSKERVMTIKNLLIKSGIDPKRVNGKGYGGTRPIANNGREESRKLNRRVELVVVKY